jgi:hypothetical protein
MEKAKRQKGREDLSKRSGKMTQMNQSIVTVANHLLGRW